MHTDFNHYFAIEKRLNNYKAELAVAKNSNQVKWLEHRVAMEEKELTSEIEFLNSKGVDTAPLTMSDDELLAELLN